MHFHEQANRVQWSALFHKLSQCTGLPLAQQQPSEQAYLDNQQLNVRRKMMEGAGMRADMKPSRKIRKTGMNKTFV